jgi:hypothetical protein
VIGVFDALWALGAGQGAPVACGGAGTPDPPTNVEQSGSPIVVTWNTGDPGRCSIVYFHESECPSVEEPVEIAQLDPGVTMYETGLTSGRFSVSHVSSDAESDRVCAEDA